MMARRLMRREKIGMELIFIEFGDRIGDKVQIAGEWGIPSRCLQVGLGGRFGLDEPNMKRW